MRFDPKFGWHSLWLEPLVYLILGTWAIKDLLAPLCKKKLTEEQKRLQNLAGITK